MKNTFNKLSLIDNFSGKNILLTGATGFVGKVLLSMLVQQLPITKQIYLLIRGDQQRTAKERFRQLLLFSPAFGSLHKQFKSNETELLALIDNKITVIDGDVTQKNLGIDPRTAQTLYQDIDLVIHLAGLVDFSPSIKTALNINVLGTLHAAEFTAACDHAVFSHISTCYVAGNQSGEIPEEVATQSPNGLSLDIEQEIKILQDSIQNITAEFATHDNPYHLEKALIEFGQNRANQLGWTNTYTYTKALAELLLVARFSHIRYTIVRPSIVESAIAYPFAGWNEGYNTCGPYCYIAGEWYPYAITKKGQIIDIIPVDLLCKAILTTSAALLQNIQKPVYQIATSYSNPLSIEVLAKYSRQWHKKIYRQTGKTWSEKYLRCLKPIKIITPDHFLSPAKLVKLINRVNDKLKKLQNLSLPGTKKLLPKLSRQLKIITRTLNYLHKVHTTYQPFMYDNSYFFINTAINEIILDEKELQCDIQNINWIDYWQNQQMPGLEQWIFSALRETENKQHSN